MTHEEVIKTAFEVAAAAAKGAVHSVLPDPITPLVKGLVDRAVDVAARAAAEAVLRLIRPDLVVATTKPDTPVDISVEVE